MTSRSESFQNNELDVTIEMNKAASISQLGGSGKLVICQAKENDLDH